LRAAFAINDVFAINLVFYFLRQFEICSLLDLRSETSISFA
jgi:hypothetical protein